jgi:hypothetical protein
MSISVLKPWPTLLNANGNAAQGFMPANAEYKLKQYA